MNKALIISDKRAGHESQSVAFARLKGMEYEILVVKFGFKFQKALSYLLDFLGLYIKIFSSQKPLANSYDMVISAGSSTYYANKFYAKKFNCKNVALMLPKGFRKNFTKIFATFNDLPNFNSDKLALSKDNITAIPVNLSFLEKKNYYNPTKKAVAFIVGGDNSAYKMDESFVEKIKKIMDKFSDYEFMITTSPRTPKNIENLLKALNFSFAVWYSENKINPIYDFVNKSEWVFLSEDSVSMISSCVCEGLANTAVIELKQIKQNMKFKKFIEILNKLNLIEIYAPNRPLKGTKKLNLAKILESEKI